MSAKKKRVAKKKTAKKTLLKKRATVKAKKIKVTEKKPRTGKVSAPKKVEGKLVGIVTHYFPHVNAAVFKLKIPLSVGDTIKVKGHTTDFTQVITSIQIDRKPINTGKKGDEIGLLVKSRVRRKDKVYKVS